MLPNDEDLDADHPQRPARHRHAGVGRRPAAQGPAIVQYLKTFSPRWKDEQPGEAIRPTPDPWVGRETDAVARGRKLYHGLAQCLSCHPAYASRAVISQAAKELTGTPTSSFRDDMYGAVLTDSDYGVKLLPPDFLRSELRSVRPEHRKEDLYRVITSGVGGTAMPTWQGSLPEEDLWALVHFVDALVALKGTDAARRLAEENQAADAAWKPPKPDRK